MPRHRLVVVFAAAGLLGPGAAARAQTPAERVTIDSIRANFAAVTFPSSELGSAVSTCVRPSELAAASPAACR